MAIEAGVCASFVLETHRAIHDFDNDAFKAALYGPAANLSPDTTIYTTDGEASGAGYTAGGMSIAFNNDTPKLVGRRLVLSMTELIWPAVSITVRGALFYNATKAGRAWAVIDLGGTITLAGKTFRLPTPTVDGVLAMYRAIPSGAT